MIKFCMSGLFALSPSIPSVLLNQKKRSPMANGRAFFYSDPQVFAALRTNRSMLRRRLNSIELRKGISGQSQAGGLKIFMQMPKR